MVMRKVISPPWPWPGGGGWGEWEEPGEPIRPKVRLGGQELARLPDRLEPGGHSEGDATRTERVGGGRSSNRTGKKKGGVIASRRSGGTLHAQGRVGN